MALEAPEARIAHQGVGSKDEKHSASGEAALALEILTAKQAKGLLQISDSTLRRYIRKGKLRAYRLAGERDLRFRREDLLALLEPAERPIGGADPKRGGR